MKFLWVTLRVNDMEASLKFYREVAGLPLNRRLSAHGGDMAFLGEGETQIELISAAGGTPAQYGRDLSIGFEVASLNEKMASVQALGLEVEGPFAPGPGVRFFFVKDPSGVRVQFVEQGRG